MEVDMSKPSRPDLKPVPEPEVLDRPRRRRFTAEYKLRILRELDECTKPGEKGAVLRREGLYSSLTSDWRRKREAGELQALEPRKRGRPAEPRNPLSPAVAQLQRDNARLQEELRKARLIIEVQKKLSAFLQVELQSDSESAD